jgi:hypothetical protein
LQMSGGQTELWQFNNAPGWKQIWKVLPTGAFAINAAGLTFAAPTTAVTATTGAAGALPAQVLGYLTVVVGTTTVKIPYYNV